MAARLFISYAHEDAEFKDEFIKTLKQLKRQDLVQEWHDREIPAGAEFDIVIREELKRADIIVFLCSRDFIGSDYCFDVEVEAALKRHHDPEEHAIVVPVIVRPCAWLRTDFAKLNALPPSGQAISTADDRDIAYLSIEDGLRRLCEDLKKHAEGRRKAPNVSRATGLMPASLTQPLIGRAAETERVLNALLSADRSNSVIVQGQGGVGKTALTQAVACDARSVERFGKQGRFFVSLETASSAAEFVEAISLAIGADRKSSVDDIVARLTGAGALLVLDNLETPLDRDSKAIADHLAALDAAPDVSLLASRRGTGFVPGAQWVDNIEVQTLDRGSAEALFRRVSGERWDGDPAFGWFTGALGGLPLAIELVATRAQRRDGLDRLWREWERVGIAFARRGDGASKDDSLAVSIELSMASPRMTEPAKRLFCLLGVLPAGISAHDRDAFLGDDAFDAEEVLLTLALAYLEGGRLDMLPPIRDFAARYHTPACADDWLGYYLEHARQAENQTAIPRLVPEFPNIEAAVLHAICSGKQSYVAQITQGLHRLTNVGSLPANDFWKSLAAAFADSDPTEAAWCWLSAGVCAANRSDHDGARDAYNQALSLYRQVGSAEGKAACIERLGDIALERSDHDGARAAYEEALPHYRRVGKVLGEANCIKSLGDIALQRSDPNGARTAYEEALPLYRQVQGVLGEASCIKGLGDIELTCSNPDGARAAYEEALPLYQQVGDVLGEANCIKGLGDIALRRSDHDGARKAYKKALKLFRQVGSLIGEAYCKEAFGDLAKAVGDAEAATACYREAAATWERLGNSAQASRVLAKNVAP